MKFLELTVFHSVANRCWLRLLRVCAAFLFVFLASGIRAKEVDFNRDVLPILSERCFQCHGPDAGSREADLRLDQFEGATAESQTGEQVLVPGKPEASVLLQRLRSTDDDFRMPPTETNLHVSESEIKLIERWIKQGGQYARHWSFVPLPDEILLPKVQNATWPISPLDRYVLARLEAEGLEPSPPADKATWLRRVTYDIIGLPPTVNEIDEFLDDLSDECYERVVDRLLASPHFGERMAVPWLDAARYADSYGYQSDLLSPTWYWRDWVIRAFNGNLPYDQFLTWQIAGDLLPNATREQHLATAFNRLHRMTNEGGSIAEEFRAEYVADRVQTLGTAVLGLTIECARCHDHKFDPISQKEFYQLTAFFDNIDEWGTYYSSDRVPTPSMLLPTAEQVARQQELIATVSSHRDTYERTLRDRQPTFQQWLATATYQDEMPGLVGYYPLDKVDKKNQLENLAEPNNPGFTSPANLVVQGHKGQGLRLVGDEAILFPKVCGSLQSQETFSVSLWLKLPREGHDGVLFHQSSGSDVGFHGTELSLRDGRLFFAMIRFWPGNAIAVQTRKPIKRGEWVHVAVTYDASISAKGMRIYVNGQAVQEIIRDNLYKSPAHSGNGIIFGQRYRDRTLQGVVIDELRAYNRDLSGIEAAQLFDGHSLVKAISERQTDVLREYYFLNIDQGVASARTALTNAQAQLIDYQSDFRETMVMQEMPQPRDTFCLARGAYDAPKTPEKQVFPDVPEAIGALGKKVPRNRLGLSRWLTNPNHPLTARVAVNRIWQIFWGRGLSVTSENFGTQGSLPSHPQLLDWLARNFVQSGWDTKQLCKTITLSATYRQSSTANRILRERDPENTLLARGPSRRLSAEMIRDTALSASGLLNRDLSGPPVSPYQPAGLWREANSMSPAYEQSVGRALYRRSIYTVSKRTAPTPNMVAFDATAREVCSARRQSTNTPIQALVLLNDIQFVESSRVLAEQMLLAGETSDQQRIRYAFVRLTGREPTNMEIALLAGHYAAQRNLFKQQPDSAQKLTALGSKPISSGSSANQLDSIELAAATVVAQTILNLDATVWKR